MADKIEKSVEDKLRQLFALQEVDSKIDQIQVLKGELPIEVSDLEDELTGLETRMNRLKDAVKEVDDEIAKHNANIKEAEALQKRYKKQLDDVKNNREFDALSKEIELQDLEMQLSQKRIGEAQIQVEAKQETLKEAKSRFNAKKKALDIKRVELEKIIEKTDKEERKLLRASKAAQGKIEPRLLAGYTKVRKAYRNGLAVVPVERDSCGGCFNKIPPQMQLEISMRRKVIACEHCGRVLVDPEIAGIAEDVEAK